MIDLIQGLDAAIEYVLEKSTANSRAHMAAAMMSQDDYDKHADALAHHAGAIEHYRNKPEVKEALDQIGKLVPARSYVNKKIKLDQAKAPEISMEDLNHDHELMQSRSNENKQAIVNSLNQKLKEAHTAFHGNKDLQALNSHSKRLLAHVAAMTEWHNLQKKGEGAHHQFSAHLQGPELEGNHTDSKYRGHSTPSATDRTKFRTQAITKNSGANWHPGLPELTSLEEVPGHPSNGKMKELYPFKQIKVNKEPLAVKSFGEEGPAQIHEQDYATDLGKEHKVIVPGQQGEVAARGGYHGTKTSEAHTALPVGGMKKTSDSQLSEYFPEATVAHLVLAKNLIDVMNPYVSMTDSDFGDYVMNSLNKSLRPSEQAAILVEASSRLEKAAKKESAVKQGGDGKYEAAHKQGVADVLSGKVTPLPLTEAGQRTEKPGEKRDELEDIAAMSPGRTMRRSPYAVPPEVFTDDTYAKVDPEKYKEWVHGTPNEQDHRNQLATYQQTIRHNPEAQAAHKKFVEAHRELARSGLGQSANEEEGNQPINDHKAVLAQAGKDLQSGKISPQEFASISKDAAKARAGGVTHKAGAAEMTDDEKRVKEADPSYQPKREGVAGKAKMGSEKDLTDIAHGKMPQHMIADKGDMGYGDDSDMQAKEMMGGRGEDDERMQTGSVSGSPDPVKLINDHPGFKSYLKMKEHLLSHYTNPAVRKYMEDKIGQHENNPNLDVDKLASTFHFLHRSRNQAMKQAEGQSKLLNDIKKEPGQFVEGPEGDVGEVGKGKANTPETMMTPEQIGRLNEARQGKASSANAGAPTPPPADPNRTAGLKTADPEYKAKLMAEYQAKANKPK